MGTRKPKPWMARQYRGRTSTKTEKLRDAVVGIAGTGGIGGALAARLVRMGVRNLKLADPDSFDVTNMNRQMGADLDHLGKTKLKLLLK